MKKLSAAFGSLPMTWPVVCVSAAIIGVYVGVINQIPILYDTSFRDIAVSYEWWVLFAVLIVSNCKSAREAGMKCLVFFLISQPIIYLVELPMLGWDKALYSIIFQYTSTQVLHVLYKRYQKQTLIIVTKRPEDVYEAIAEITNHDATLIKGEGCYSKQECDVVYSVVGRDEVNKVVNTVRKTDPQAFVNMIRTENLAGRFYQRPND